MKLSRVLGVLAWLGSFVHLVSSLVNPILPGWNPDPTILRVGDDYFISTSSFEYYPGHPIYHSKNLVNWTLIGHALNRPSQLRLFGTPSDAGEWGLSLRYHNGTFYLASTSRFVYTYEDRLFPRSYFVTTNDIFSNNWSDPIYFDSLGYDPDLFWDTNGEVYTTWSGNNNPIDKIYGIYQNKIDITTGDSLTPAELIFNGTLPDNSTARPEGPHVYLINGTYYLLIAEGGSSPEHRSTIQRGPTPSGPWENNPANPILFNGANMSLPVQYTGHSDIVEGPDGQWWGVCLAVRPQTPGDYNHIQLGRETFLFPVTWQDGWPVFNNGQPLSTEIPGVLTDEIHTSDYFNDFTADTLDDSYYFLRTPYKKFYSLTARPGFLRLKGNSFALGDRDNPALLLRKQTSYQETFETVLDGFTPVNNLTEAGATIFYGDFAHNDIGVVGAVDGSGDRFVVTRTLAPAQQVGPWALTTGNATITNVTYTPLRTKSDPVKLVIVGTPTSYSLGYAEGNDTQITFTVTFDSVTMSVVPSIDFFFKGAAFGVYSTGNSKPILNPADFAYWNQTPVNVETIMSSSWIEPLFGFHRTFTTSITFDRLSSPEGCSVHLYYKFPVLVFVDTYELANYQHLYSFKHHGMQNLEFPVAAMDPNGTSLLLTLNSVQPQMQVKVPLHLRYGHVSREPYQTAEIASPDLFISCSESVSKTYLTSYDSLPPEFTSFFQDSSRLYAPLQRLYPTHSRVEILTAPVGQFTDLAQVRFGTAFTILAMFFYMVYTLYKTARRLGKHQKTE